MKRDKFCKGCIANGDCELQRQEVVEECETRDKIKDYELFGYKGVSAAEMKRFMKRWKRERNEKAKRKSSEEYIGIVKDKE